MGTFDKYLQLADKTYFNRLGKVTKIVGLTIESVGPNAKLNDLCRIIRWNRTANRCGRIITSV